MPVEKIISVQNPRVKSLVRLREHKQREETGLTIVEGRRELARALSCGIDFKEAYFCPAFLDKDSGPGLLEKLGEKKVPLIEVNESVFTKIAFGDRAEGVLGVCRPRVMDLRDLTLSQKPLIVLAEAIEKPGNLGAIVRTCDAAGVDALIVCDELTDPYNPNVVRASLGTVFAVPVFQSAREEAVNFLKTKAITICATLPEAKNDYSREDFNRPLAIVIGSEQKGLSDFWIEHSDLKVKIPMRGLGDSLNASVSAAVVVYEAVRQRDLTEAQVHKGTKHK